MDDERERGDELPPWPPEDDDLWPAEVRPGVARHGMARQGAVCLGAARQGRAG
jgi:hypothetical protein